MKKRYNIKIEPLTAVHIGTGEELTPLDYNVHKVKTKDGGAKNIYAKFSSDNMLARLIENRDKNLLHQFELSSNSGNMKDLQKFFHTNFTLDDLDYPCDVTKEFMEIYNSKIGGNPVDNALEVLQMYRPAGKKTPVIPGSSIKGSIRTALLNGKQGSLKDVERKYNIRDLEHNILKFTNEKNDPLRAISVSDAFFEARNSQYVGVIKNISLNKSENELKEIGVQIMAEMIFGNLLKIPTSSQMKISIDEDLQKAVIKSDNQKKNFSMNTKITMQNIVDKCNEFFASTFYDEYGKFYKPCYDGMDMIVQLKKQIDEIYKSRNSFLLRLGRWSQVEFVTLQEPFRKPKNKKGYGGTRTLLDYNGNFVPLGWCKCTLTECKN